MSQNNNLYYRQVILNLNYNVCMDKTLLYILENYSYNPNKPNDTYNLIGDEELFKLLIKLRNNRKWSELLYFSRKYFPSALQQYLGNPKYTITLDNGKNFDFYVIYNYYIPNNGEIGKTAGLNPYYKTRYNVELFPPILSYTDRAIDAIIAHELTHAKRILSGVAKQLSKDKKYKNEEEQKKKKEKIDRHEEYWTDRQLKKMLPIVNPKYYKKLERKKTLQALHQEDKTRWVTTGLIQTKTSEWWDELFPFSNINRIIK